jgi:hypothetical protein
MAKTVVITKGITVSESTVKPPSSIAFDMFDDIEKPTEDTGAPKKRFMMDTVSGKRKEIDFSMFQDMAEVGEAEKDKEGLSQDMYVLGSETAAFQRALNSVHARQGKRPKQRGRKQMEHDLSTAGSVFKQYLFGE